MVQTMRHFIGTLVLAGLTYSESFAWEVNTHLAIEKTALTEQIKNLESFATDAGLRDKTYENQQFQEYGTSYFDYIHTSETSGVSSWNIEFIKFDYKNLIGAGAVLEDVVWPESVSKANWGKYSPWGGDGRFNYHFMDTQDGNDGLSLAGPFFPKTNLLDWARDGGGASKENRYSYTNALNYFASAFSEPSKEDREKNEALLLVSLGHLLHLLNDASVPAHTRDDAHALGDGLEEWMRGSKGYTSGFYYNTEIQGSLIGINGASGVKYSSMSAFFEDEASYTGHNFYSDDTISLDGGFGLGYYHYAPTENEVTFEEREPGSRFGYVMHDGKKIAMYVDTEVWQSVHNETTREYDISMNNDNSVFADIGPALISRAIGNAKNFINYVFRGRMEVIHGASYGKFTIKNISDSTLVADGAADFNEGVLKIYYDTKENERKLLKEVPLSNIVVNAQSEEIDITNELDLHDDIDSSKKLTLLFDGTIGTQRGLSVTKLGICANAAGFYFNYEVLKEKDNEKFVYYHDNPLEMGAIVNIDLYALDSQGEIFTDFSPECYQNFFFAVVYDLKGEKGHDKFFDTNEQNQTHYVPLQDQMALKDTGNYYTFMPDKSRFKNGEYHEQLKINFDKYNNRRLSPTKMMITDTYFITDEADYLQDRDMNVTFVYARLHNDDLATAESSFDLAVHYLLYCDTDLYNPEDFNITNAESESSIDWFLLTPNPNLDFMSVSSSVAQVDITKVNSNTIHIEKNGYNGSINISYSFKSYLSDNY